MFVFSLKSYIIKLLIFTTEADLGVFTFQFNCVSTEILFKCNILEICPLNFMNTTSKVNIVLTVVHIILNTRIHIIFASGVK